MQFSANLSFLFTEHPFLDRFAAAANAGFKGVEYMFPYEYAPEVLQEHLRATGVQQVLFNLPAGNWAAGERGIACHPDRRAEFRDGVRQALSFAKKLVCCRVNCLAGLRPAGVDEAECLATFHENLRYAADFMQEAGVRLLIEPINSRIDMPGFWLDTPEKALRIIESLGHPNLGLQFDVYHAAVMGGDLLLRLQKMHRHIGHIQMADYPGRHEPGSGQIDFSTLLQQLAALSYSGWLGCEYHPSAGTLSSLSWMKKCLLNP